MSWLKRIFSSSLAGIILSFILVTLLIWDSARVINDNATDQIIERLESAALMEANSVHVFLSTAVMEATSLSSAFIDEGYFDDGAAEKLNDLLAYTSACDAIIITRKMEYVGIIPQQALFPQEFNKNKFLAQSTTGAAISDVFFPPSHIDKKHIAVAVPIFSGSERTANIVLFYDTSLLGDIVNVSSISQSSDSHVFQANGTCVLNDHDQSGSIYDISFASFEDNFTFDYLLRRILEGKSGNVTYTMPGSAEALYAFYTPVGMNGWYVLTTIPASAMNEYMSATHSFNLMLLIRIIFVLAILMLITYLNIWHNRKQVKSADAKLALAQTKLDFARSQMPGLMFDIDYLKGMVTVAIDSGGAFTAQVVGRILEDTGNLADIVHPSDADPIGLARLAGENGERIFESEVRLRSSLDDDSYYWHRINIVNVYTNEGRLSAGIGSIDNIHEDKEQELSQNSVSRHDLLTGLLNSDEGGRMVADYLKSSADACGTLMLISMGNLESLGESSGQSMVTQALLMLARTMAQVFRTTDISARVGEDEFWVFLGGMKEERFIESRIFLMRRKLLDMCKNAGLPVEIEFSIGYYITRVGDDCGSIFARAEIALSHAKKSGKNRQFMYMENMKE